MHVPCSLRSPWAPPATPPQWPWVRFPLTPLGSAFWGPRVPGRVGQVVPVPEIPGPGAVSQPWEGGKPPRRSRFCSGESSSCVQSLQSIIVYESFPCPGVSALRFAAGGLIFWFYFGGRK